LFEEELEEEQQLTLQDYLRILYRGRWIIIISFILVMLVTVYITFTTPPEYQASATVLVESGGSMERKIFEADPFGGQTTLITNQIEIIKSRYLAERTIQSMEASSYKDSILIFQPDEDGNHISFRSAVQWLRDHMEVENRKDTDIIEIKFSAQTPFESAFITNQIADNYSRINIEKSQTEVFDLRKFLEDQLAIKEKELRSAEEKLREYQEEKKVANLDNESAELVTRLSNAESMLEQAQIDLNGAMQRKTSIEGQLEERKSSLGDDLGGISTPYILSLQNELGQAVAERTKFIVLIESQAENPNRVNFENQLKTYDEKIAALRQKLDEESKKLKTSGMVTDAFAMSQELITNLMRVDTEIKSLNAKIGALKEVVGDYDNELESLPSTIIALARLQRDKKVKEETYLLMTQKLEETKITQAGKAGNVNVLDAAIEPIFPIKPKKKLNFILGALIGIGLGIGLSFVIEYFDNTIKRVEEIERLGLNFLGSIPEIQENNKSAELKQKDESDEEFEGKQIESRLITHFDPKSPISESYRTLRTNLKFTVRLDEPLQTIMITSAGPKEGKSTTIANLAITVAQLGRAKLVLVDSDLRRPVIHSIFGMEKENGLTNHIVDDVPYEDVIKKSIINNLSIVTCGILPPNPSELLGSQKMEDFINRLKKDFEIVLFDSPPVIAVTDAAVLSHKVDSVFLVASAGQTNRDAISRAKILLDNVNANVVGALLNNVEMGGKFSGSYHYYYQYYSDRKGKKKRA